MNGFAIQPQWQRFEDTAHYKLMCTALLIWWAAFVFRSFEVSSVSRDASSAAATEQGSLVNQALVLAFAAMGMFHMPRAWQVLKSREGRNLVLLLLAYSSWAAASMMWSEDVSIGSRRLVAFILLLIGCCGIGAGFYSRVSNGPLALARHVIYGAVLAAVILLPPRLSMLTLADIVDPSFNIKDTTEIVVMIHPIGYGFLAALVVFRGRVLLRSIVLAFYFLVLLFLKGRSMLGEIVACSIILISRLTTALPVRRLLLTTGLLMAAIFADLGTGGRIFISYVRSAYDSFASVSSYVTVGDGLNNLTSLSGRLRLWNALYEYIGQQPWIGYGFGSFWTPEHLDQIFQLATWRAVIAHSGYLDELLATGIIGLLLFSAAWTYGIVISLRAARNHDETTGYLIFSWLLLYVLFNVLDSVNQSFLKSPFFISLTGLFALLPAFAEELAPEMALDSEVYVLERARA